MSEYYDQYVPPSAAEAKALRARAGQAEARIAALEESLARCNENRGEWIATHRQDAKRIAALEAENARLEQYGSRLYGWIEGHFGAFNIPEELDALLGGTVEKNDA